MDNTQGMQGWIGRGVEEKFWDGDQDKGAWGGVRGAEIGSHDFSGNATEAATGCVEYRAILSGRR